MSARATRAAAHEFLGGMGEPLQTAPDLRRFVRQAGDGVHPLSVACRDVLRAPGGMRVATDGSTLVVSYRKPAAPAKLGPLVVCNMAAEVVADRDVDASRAGHVAEVDAERLRALLDGLTGTVRIRVGPVLSLVPSLDVCGPGWAARIVGRRGDYPVRS